MSVIPSIVVFVIFIFGVLSFALNGWLALALWCAAATVVLCDIVLSLHRRGNALSIKTPDGSHQPFHPSVVHFEQAWNGFEYWMAFTPYPFGAAPYTDRWENPTVVASHDGIHWQYPAECAFLDDLDEHQIKSISYFSDTHLVYDAEKDALCIYYRLNDKCAEQEQMFLFHRYTQDGIRWSERETCTGEFLNMSKEPVSPAVLRKDDCYHMWYVEKGIEHHRIMRAASVDGLTWQSDDKPVLLQGKAVNPWHIDCQWIDGRYYMVVYELSQKISIWQSPDGYTFDFVTYPLRCRIIGDIGAFYNHILYRSCLVKTADGFKLYFACGTRQKTHIGCMQGGTIKSLRVTREGDALNGKTFLKDLIYKYTLFARQLLSKLKT